MNSQPEKPEIPQQSTNGQNVVIARIIMILAALLCVAALAPIADADWFQDDTFHILENPAVRGSDILQVFTLDFWGRSSDSPETGIWSYRPLATLFSRLAWHISPTPVMARMLNLALHLLAGLLLYRLSRRILPPIGAGVAGAIFLLHPTHGEVLSFAAGRADILAFLFMAACFALYLGKHNKAALAVFFLGLLAKESALLVALPVGVHALASGRWRSVGAALYGALPYALIAAFNYLLHYRVTGLWSQPADGLTNPLINADWLTSIIHMAAFPGWYLWRLLWPMHYPADFCGGSFAVRSLSDPVLWAGVATSALAIFIVVALWRRSTEWRACAIGLGLFFALGAVAFQWLGKGSFVMADRLMYASCAGLAIAAGCVASESGRLLSRIKPDSMLLQFLPGLIATVFIAASFFAAIPAFGSSMQLAMAQLENSPGGARANHMLANALSKKGEFAAALEYYIRADKAYPGIVIYRTGMAKALSEMGREKEAGAILEQMYKENPLSDEDMGFSYATHLWRVGRLEEAVKVYSEVAAAYKNSFRAAFELGRITETLGRPQEALTLIEKACRMPGADGERCHMQATQTRIGLIKWLLEKGEPDKARREIETQRPFALPEEVKNELSGMILKAASAEAPSPQTAE